MIDIVTLLFMIHNNMSLSTFDVLMRPTVQALKELGGSGTIEEINRKVFEILLLPDALLEIPHGDTSQTEIEYRLAWSRTYLKKRELITNSSRGVRTLTSDAITPNDIDPRQIVKQVNGTNREKRIKVDEPANTQSIPKISETVDDTENFEAAFPDDIAARSDRLHKVLLGLSPDAFERLAQRLLRESGFVEVRVTGKSNDGGIDGIGIARISGFLSFRVLFQCKRYQGAVSSREIRDFRGSLTGRTDNGLFITTGTFTREAVNEATRDGAPPIDLVDGEKLVQKLKELRLGVHIRVVESVEIDEGWFAKL